MFTLSSELSDSIFGTVSPHEAVSDELSEVKLDALASGSESGPSARVGQLGLAESSYPE